MHCSKCNINWAKLRSDDDINGNYESCPVCRTDDFIDFESEKGEWVMCQITGKIYSCLTGNDMPLENNREHELKINEHDINAWVEKKEMMRQEDDARINYYIEVCERQGLEAGKEAYTNYKRQ